MNSVGPKLVKTPRSHRHTKSGSAINPPISQPKHMTSHAPRNAPNHHHTAHHLQNPPPRAYSSEPNTPQTPKADGKKRRRQRKVKDSPIRNEVSDSEGVPVPQSAPVMSDSSESGSPREGDGIVYAGPTFHHSPAPASLPVPKFFSKSIPGAGASLQARLDADDNTSGSPPVNEENHLEKLFNADRAQRQSRRAADESSDDSSSDTSNRDAFFGMEPDSPFGARFPTTKSTTRPHHGRSVTEPTNSTIPDQSPLNLGQKQATTPISHAALQFLNQSPYSPMGSPTASPSPSPASRSTRAQPTFPYYDSPGNGSPVPPRRANYGYGPGAPPKPPQFYLPQQYHHSRPPVFHNPQSPGRQPHPIFLHAKKDVAPMACLDDVTSMEHSLRRILKLESNELARPGPVAI